MLTLSETCYSPVFKRSVCEKLIFCSNFQLSWRFPRPPTMEQSLADLSIDYHGPLLIDQLAEEHVQIQLPNFLALSQQGRNKEHPWNQNFARKMTNFIARKADVLFAKHEPSKKSFDRHEDLYAVMPPLEKYMNVPAEARKTHFFQSLQANDLVICNVYSVEDQGLVVNVLGLDGEKTRFVSDLKIKAFCPLREIPQTFTEQSPLEAFTSGDKVRAIVLGVSAESERILVSVHQDSLPKPATESGTQLGLLRDEDVPSHFKQEDAYGSSYIADMRHILQFSNPRNTSTLCQMFDVPETIAQSAMRGLSSLKIPETDTAVALRKAQSQRWALDSVKEGVAFFKKGKYTEALQLFNKAIDIDAENVEALVARGALYANNESYDKAVADFEEAMKLDPKHANARKYLCHTLVAKARSVFEAGEEKEAAEFYQRTLEIDPEMEEAKVGLKSIERSQQKRTPNKVEVKVSSYGPVEPPVVDLTDEPESSSNKKTTETLRKLIKGSKPVQQEETPKRGRQKSSRDREESGQGSGRNSDRRRSSGYKDDFDDLYDDAKVSPTVPRSEQKVASPRGGKRRGQESPSKQDKSNIDWQNIASVMDGMDVNKIKKIYELVKKQESGSSSKRDADISDDVIARTITSPRKRESGDGRSERGQERRKSGQYDHKDERDAARRQERRGSDVRASTSAQADDYNEKQRFTDSGKERKRKSRDESPEQEVRKIFLRPDKDSYSSKTQQSDGRDKERYPRDAGPKTGRKPDIIKKEPSSPQETRKINIKPKESSHISEFEDIFEMRRTISSKSDKSSVDIANQSSEVRNIKIKKKENGQDTETSRLRNEKEETEGGKWKLVDDVTEKYMEGVKERKDKSGTTIIRSLGGAKKPAATTTISLQITRPKIASKWEDESEEEDTEPQKPARKGNKPESRERKFSEGKLDVVSTMSSPLGGRGGLGKYLSGTRDRRPSTSSSRDRRRSRSSSKGRRRSRSSSKGRRRSRSSSRSRRRSRSSSRGRRRSRSVSRDRYRGRDSKYGRRSRSPSPRGRYERRASPSRNRFRSSRDDSTSRDRKRRRSPSSSSSGSDSPTVQRKKDTAASPKPWKSKWDTPSPKQGSGEKLDKRKRANKWNSPKESLEDLENFLLQLKKKKPGK